MAERLHSVAINPAPGKGEMTVLFCGHAETLPLHKAGPQVLDYHLVHLVTSGKGTFRCMGRDYRLGPGDSFFIFPGELVAYASDEVEPWNYRWIAFKGSRADESLSALGISQHQPVTHSRDFRRLGALFHKMERTLASGRPGSDLQAGGYLRLALAEYAQEAAAAAPPVTEGSMIQQQVEQAIRWLTLQYYQPISIEHMAKTLGYHRTHLSKMFKQHTGMSPMQYLLQVRMERAKRLLHERLTIEQVASSVGFADALYFSKQFKKWYGVSPSDYRNSQGAAPV
ncbi:AraC family transcriptional regulator [Paenibacillus mucilaginosus]|uniref:AraC family transcriptional regulator n=2 Tax=Paenibacillus mucilaginosus TaxID=61624 RepID=I0BEZ2_9BACL|nr:AraC family transcriptional regulator [Paenibacillus mucilaginosus]AEI40114.1 transcriptional regulator, AraC family [Paenibacillus mucilaginosus KNP414]AFH60939.1 AraC family transcriptional regulator [Paenibacillus mucilaginosus K02]MCG7215717.1 AraC family transcriptional regulator [Paenibacillus mucilaginosus]WDM29348.1 AraC family transcriptional regulator [Paenibacillus mucilaginosus]